MNDDQTKCTGKKCTQREKCKRFIEGKDQVYGGWFDGKAGNEIYEDCELFLEV